MEHMKKLALLLLLLPSLAFADEKTYGYAVATVVSVHDGDTITVDLDGEWPELIGEHIGVRVDGVDTRELSKGGEPAKAFVEKLLPKGSKVRLHEMKRDKYFRIVAKVGFHCNDLDLENPLCSDLAATLITKKYGVPYDGGEKKPFPREVK